MRKLLFQVWGDASAYYEALQYTANTVCRERGRGKGLRSRWCKQVSSPARPRKRERERERDGLMSLENLESSGTWKFLEAEDDDANKSWVRRKEQERAASFDEVFKHFGKSTTKCKKYMGDTFSTLLLLTPYLLSALDTCPGQIATCHVIETKLRDLIHWPSSWWIFLPQA